jgi:hypothetical protein
VQLTKFHREIISRTTTGAVAAGLLYGGVKCLVVAREFADASVPARSGQSSGAGLPLGAGIVLVVLGAVFALAAVTPSSLFGRIMGGPTNTTLWENPETPGRWWWWW